MFMWPRHAFHRPRTAVSVMRESCEPMLSPPISITDARSGDPESFYLRWSARFERSGSDLMMPSHTLDLMSAVRGPYAILVDCKPGYMRQEQ